MIINLRQTKKIQQALRATDNTFGYITCIRCFNVLFFLQIYKQTYIFLIYSWLYFKWTKLFPQTPYTHTSNLYSFINLNYFCCCFGWFLGVFFFFFEENWLPESLTIIVFSSKMTGIFFVFVFFCPKAFRNSSYSKNKI